MKPGIEIRPGRRSLLAFLNVRSLVGKNRLPRPNPLFGLSFYLAWGLWMRKPRNSPVSIAPIHDRTKAGDFCNSKSDKEFYYIQ